MALVSHQHSRLLHFSSAAAVQQYTQYSDTSSSAAATHKRERGEPHQEEESEYFCPSAVTTFQKNIAQNKTKKKIEKY